MLDALARDLGSVDLDPARGAQEAVLGEVDTGAVATPVELPEDERRGAAVGPTAFEAVAAYGSPEQLAAALDDNYQAAAGQVAALLAEREAWVAEQVCVCVCVGAHVCAG
eukprot:XP_001703104.1 predicted protein [Chlamydomonas reinhardtii]